MVICDKCGGTIQEPVNKNTFYLSDYEPVRGSYGGFFNPVTVHLCLRCQKKVVDFLNGKRDND